MNQIARQVDLDLTDPEQIFRYAAERLSLGEMGHARDFLERAAHVHPNDPRLFNFLGNACVLENDLVGAQAAYGRALELAPYDPDTLLNKSNLHHLKGELAQARQFAERALGVDSAATEAQFRLALLSATEGDIQGSLVYLNKLLQNVPNFVPALLQRAVLRIEQGQSIQALVDLNACIDFDPHQTEAVLHRGDIFLEYGYPEAAALDYETAIARGETSDALYYNYGKSLVQLNRLAEAKVAFTKALEKNPEASDLFFALGTIDLEEKNYVEAVLNFTQALVNNKKHVDSLNNRAIAYKNLNDFNSALIDYERILEIEPDNIRALQNTAVTCLELKDFTKALDFIDKAVRLNSTLIEPYLIKGHILAGKGDYAKAIEIYEIARTKNPNKSEPDLQLGNLYRLIRNYDKAIEYYSSALKKGSEDRYLRGDLVFTKLQTCDWESIDEELAALIADTQDRKASISPFIFLTFCDHADKQRIVAENYVADFFPTKTDIDPIETYKDHQKIRIGYYSADFNDHATMHLMANLFEIHDRSRFETYAFSFGPQKSDKMRMRAEAAFDHFIDVNDLSDKAIALASRYFEIDIAVDIKGYTTHSRPNIFSYRAAPVQINYLGFPGTMGAPFIDYIIADEIIIPKGSEQFYTEKVLRLSNCYQVNDQQRPSLVTELKRSELGLPEDRFVFCSFNNNYKILPHIIDAWAEILNKVPESVFWILADNKTAEKNIKNEFTKRGVQQERLIFAGRMPSELHLARQACADLFLDTYPCAAHTTASDAVYAGLPLLALTGQTFASRVSASILNAVGLPDLVTHSFDEYVARAIELARNPDRCRSLSEYLRRTVRLSPLFNTQHIARELEALYTEVHHKVTDQ
ncbi:tetratricopeptide repeat protein [Rhizobiales bacterium TNE-4]|nr:tetratricopeptide repeat protein [Rhizobiales bacterium TNE-4]MBV1828614.1 tetratricopeptide repeat protein [Rhizobiales bacterium TNE-4]